MKPATLVLGALLVGCSHGNGASGGKCSDATDPPSTLDCTGLYDDLAAKRLSDGARAYAPAAPLWADGADKQRWIELPPGTTIDSSMPSEWTFPIGTKVWKEFSVAGKRIETRYFEKTQAHFWVYATYVWNGDDSAAVRSFGADLTLASGASYHVPSPDECDQCHRGRTDRLLGFEQASLGLPGASGLTLAELVAEGRLAPAPSLVDLRVGDDGTGAAAPALGWLHVNCGVSCHNANSNSTGYGAGMDLRLDPTLLDGRPSTDFAARTTTVGVSAKSAAYDGQPRIVPGDPAHSLLVALASLRGPTDQMPPIATRAIDDAGLGELSEWIRRMPAEVDDGGPPEDAGSDAHGMDASMMDAGAEDARADAGDAGDDASSDGAADAADAGQDAGNDATTEDGGAGDAEMDGPG
jgi:hypothetical protein